MGPAATIRYLKKPSPPAGLLHFQGLFEITMLRPAYRFAALFALAATIFVGCTRNEPAASDDPTAVRNDLTPFDTEHEITADTHFVAGQMHESHAQVRPGQPIDERAIAIHHRKAIEQYAKALKINPNHTGALHRCATLLTQAKQYDAAIEYWERYVAAVGETPDAIVNVAITYELAGRNDEARAMYEKALTKNPSHQKAAVNLGMLLARRGELTDAANMLSKVLEPASVHWHLAHALQFRGDHTAAERHFRAAESLDPRFTRETQASVDTSSME